MVSVTCERRYRSSSRPHEPDDYPNILQNIPPTNRVLELVPGRHPRKPLRTLKSQAEY
jgi:hypothetical protein